MTAPVQIRPATDSEMLDFLRAFSVAFGESATPEELEEWRAMTEVDRTLAAFEDGKIVGTAAIDSFYLTLPGLTVTSAAGVTLVSVLPTHRRRGILTDLMRRQIADIHERGEAVALLYASETTIYGRFGYGLSTMHAHYEIETQHAALAERAPRPVGEVILVDRDQARTELPPVYDRFRRLHPGGLNRSDRWWTAWLKDSPRDRRGASERFYAAYRGDSGEVEGYVAYRMKGEWPLGIPTYTLRIDELISTTADAYTALWRYCLSMDLATIVTIRHRPLDEPLRWMLADPRRLRVERAVDGLWARLVDVPAALSARRYLTEGRLVFSVVDPFCPAKTGLYLLEGGPDGAHCRRTLESADLELHIDDLGAIYLGGVPLSILVEAGRVREVRRHAIAKADSMFSSLRAPWADQDF